MKKIVVMLCAAFILLSAFVFQNSFNSGIRGTINPADGAVKIWATNGHDTASVASPSGVFSLNVVPGNWKLFVQAAKPYKDLILPNIIVEKGRYYDVGEIKLSKD